MSEWDVVDEGVQPTPRAPARKPAPATAGAWDVVEDRGGADPVSQTPAKGQPMPHRSWSELGSDLLTQMSTGVAEGISTMSDVPRRAANYLTDNLGAVPAPIEKMILDHGGAAADMLRTIHGARESMRIEKPDAQAQWQAENAERIADVRAHGNDQLAPLSAKAQMQSQLLNEADGAWDTAKTIATNPSMILTEGAKMAGQMAPAAPAAIFGGPAALGAMGAEAGGMTAEQVEQQVGAADPELLAKLQPAMEVARATVPQLAQADDATVLKYLADTRATDAFGPSTAVNSVLPKLIPGGTAIERAIGVPLAAQEGGSMAANMIRGLLGEGATETIQGGADQAIQNVATEQPTMQDVGKQGVLEGLLAAGPGAFAGVTEPVASRVQTAVQQAPQQAAAPVPVPGEARADQIQSTNPEVAQANRAQGADGAVAATADQPGQVSVPQDLRPRMPEAALIPEGMTLDRAKDAYRAAQTDGERASAAAVIGAIQMRDSDSDVADTAQRPVQQDSGGDVETQPVADDRWKRAAASAVDSNPAANDGVVAAAANASGSDGLRRPSAEQLVSSTDQVETVAPPTTKQDRDKLFADHDPASSNVESRVDGDMVFTENKLTRRALDYAINEAPNKSAGTLIETMAKQPDLRPEQKWLAEKLAPTLHSLGVKLEKASADLPYAGAYDNVDNSIWIRQADPDTILHEALHGVTSSLMTSKEARDSNPQVKKAVQEFDDMLAHLRNHVAFGEANWEDDPIVSRMLNSKQGPTSNIKELLAYGMTEKPFQAWLKTVPPPPGREGPRNMWEAFKQAIMQVFGAITAKQRSFLDALIESSGDLVDFAGKNPDVARRAQRSEADRFSKVRDIQDSKPKLELAANVDPQTVYHGTPHNVEKFSLQKVGTGEGSQAYGWGLYFASQKQIATYYRDNLGGGPIVNNWSLGNRNIVKNGDYVDYSPRGTNNSAPAQAWAAMAEELLMHEYEIKQAFTDAGVEGARDVITKIIDEKIETHSDKDSGDYWPEVLPYFKVIRNNAQNNLNLDIDPNKGKIYKTDVPEDDDLLDWDKTVNDQPENVGKVLKKIIGDEAGSNRYLDETFKAAPSKGGGSEYKATGGDIYQHLTRKLGPQGASEYLLEAGIPGLRYLDGLSRASGEGTHNYVVWDENAIATPQLDPALIRPAEKKAQRETLLGHLATQGYPLGENVQQAPDGRWMPLKEAADTMRTTLQDKMLPLLRAQDKTGAKGKPGVTSVELADNMNAYRLETLMHGAVEDLQKQAEFKFILPIQRQLKNIGMSVDTFQGYLVARATEEVNKAVSGIKGAMQDGASGMTNAQAKAVLDGTGENPYTGKPMTEKELRQAAAIAPLIDGLRNATLDAMVDAGQITPKLRAQLKAKYEHYVPMRGKDIDDWMSGTDGTGKGLSQSKANIKRRLGRGEGNLPQNILGEMAGDIQRANIAKGKAKVNQAFLRFAIANPMPELYTVEPVDLEWKYSDATGEAYLGVKGVQDDLKRSMIVMDNGEQVRIRFEDEKLRDAILNMGVDDYAGFVKIVGAVNRWRSAVLTRFNPAFTPVNIVRDAIFGMTAVTAEKGVKVAAEAGLLYHPASMAVAQDNLGNQGDSSVPDEKKTIKDWVREAVETGMKTGLTQIDDVTDLQRRMSIGATTIMQLAAEGKNFTAAKESIYRAGKPILEAIENVNDAYENALRVSTYIALRKRGESKERAAEYAKNLTINFNRRGKLGPLLNSIYLFYNASVQGTHATVRVLRNPKVQAFLVGMAGMQAMLAASMMGNDKDDDGDDISEWDSIPDYQKRTSLIIPLSSLTGRKGDYFALPMPFGFNVFTYSGGRLMQWHKEGARETDPNFVSDILKTTSESFSPLPISDGYGAMFGDQIGFAMQLAANKDDMGRPIADEEAFGKYPQPKATGGRPDTPRVYHVAAQLLAKLGGGNLEKRIPPVGYLDVAPEQIEAVVNYMGGGLTSLGNKAVRWWEQMDAKNLETAMDQISATPIAGRFVGSGNAGRAIADRYYKERGELTRKKDVLQDELRESNDQVKTLQAAGSQDPDLQGMLPDRYKVKHGTHHKGDIKKTETGGVQVKLDEASPQQFLKNTEKKVTALNKDIRGLRDPEMTNDDAVALVKDYKIKHADIGLPDGYTATAVMPNRVRQRAIKLLQDIRKDEEQQFLKGLKENRDYFEVGKKIDAMKASGEYDKLWGGDGGK